MRRVLALVILLAISAPARAAIVSDEERITVVGLCTDSAGNPVVADSFELWASKTGGSVRLVSAGPVRYLPRLGGGYLFNTFVNVLTNREGSGIYTINFQLSRNGNRLVTANFSQIQAVPQPLTATLDSLKIMRRLSDSLAAALDTLRALAGYVVRGAAPVRQISQLGQNDRLNERMAFVRPNATGDGPDTFVVGVEQVGGDRDPKRVLITFQWLADGAVWLDWHWSEVHPNDRPYSYTLPDVNRDGVADISDLAALIDWLILGVPANAPDTTGIFTNRQ